MAAAKPILSVGCNSSHAAAVARRGDLLVEFFFNLIGCLFVSLNPGHRPFCFFSNRPHAVNRPSILLRQLFQYRKSHGGLSSTERACNTERKGTPEPHFFRL